MRSKGALDKQAGSHWLRYLKGCKGAEEFSETGNLRSSQHRSGYIQNKQDARGASQLGKAEFDLLAALKLCSRTRDLKRGRQVHAAAAVEGAVRTNIYVASSLINMYAKCGSMVQAQQVFDGIVQLRDVVSWNTLILGYAENGQGEAALDLFKAMASEGCEADALSCLGALKACSSIAAKEEGKQVDGKVMKLQALEEGMAIHSHSARLKFDSHGKVGNALLELYMLCGSVLDAEAVFERMACRNVVSFTIMMLGYTENGESEQALQLFSRMRAEGCSPDGRAFVAALKACSRLAVKEQPRHIDGKLVRSQSLEKGKDIHSQIPGALDIFIGSSLIDMYATCGSMIDAVSVFDRIPQHDLVSMNALMLGYAENGEPAMSLNLFASLTAKACAQDTRSFVAALKACTSLAQEENGVQVHGKVMKLKSLEKGMAIHLQATRAGCDQHSFVSNTLIDMYAKCGSMGEAQKVFDRMQSRDVVSWSALILGYVENGDAESALKLFECMEREGCVPNGNTFSGVLKACMSLVADEDGTQVNGRLVKLGVLEKTMAVHSQAEKHTCDTNISVASSLINLYAACGSLIDARRLFDKLLPDCGVVLWTVLIMGYVENGEGELALKIFWAMQAEGILADSAGFVAALKACSSVVSLGAGKRIHAEICSSGLEDDPLLSTCLMDFYGKCGSMASAQHVFDSQPWMDSVSWTALTSGYTRQGDCSRVFKLFHEMQENGLEVNAVMFLCVLTACSHSGLVGKGKAVFQAMASSNSKYVVRPGVEHYVCMVDMLSRANELEAAVELLKAMPFKANAVAWMSVLGACQKWRNVEIGRLAFECLLEIDAKNPAAYDLMASIYASVGMTEEQRSIEAMKSC